MGNAVREASVENFEAMFRGLISSRPENLAYILIALHNTMAYGKVFDGTAIVMGNSKLTKFFDKLDALITTALVQECREEGQ